eukprot:CAMPEP_0170167174 /NCGR_PEP_ID=MMETSP0040_2-20121228/655_1 /TAXON_ID=641309 /ORGANISM="Lotharella oceanica, Strain CCMP622" /LENGTH=428 /DNA_ID=CAMNT_0010405117 /DNA_START=47 /DNA_END=1330 /DNA_ORIENTATION=+
MNPKKPNPNAQHQQGQQWAYPVALNQYAAYGGNPLHLSSPANASVVPVPMMYPAKSGGVGSPHAQQPQAQLSGHTKPPQGGRQQANIVLPQVRGVDDTIVEVPPDQMKELLEIREIKQRRLARKAELARLSRRRTRDMLASVQEEITSLKQQLKEVRSRSKRPCVRCDKRLALPVEKVMGPGEAKAVVATEVKNTFEIAKLRMPKFTDSLKAKDYVESHLENARVVIHRSMVGCLEAFTRAKKERPSDSGTAAPVSGSSRPSSTGPEGTREGMSHDTDGEESKMDEKLSGLLKSEGLEESTEEVMKFLVENLVTYYKRRHLVQRFNLAALHLHMHSSVAINTLLCFLSNDPSTFEGSNLFAELKLTPEQKSQAARIRHHVRRQLVSEQQIMNLHGFLTGQVDPRAKPQALDVLRVDAMVTKSQHDNIW